MDDVRLQKEILKSCPNIEIIFPTDKSYDTDRVMANLRFNYKPLAIAYCKNVQEVAACIKLCNQFKHHFGCRVRSGGHQHEGMSSGNGVFMIDMSKMNIIEYGAGDETAWIPAGIALQYVYTQLKAKNRIIPGGGCNTVAVGGLTQGGGWGPSSRKLGLTCDNIQQAEIVLANGDVIIVNKDNEYKDLFWAIKGGGGGNFGIVTRFLFKLTRLKGTVTTFTICFHKKEMKAFVNKWVQTASQLDDNLTTFCRLSVVEEDTIDTPSILLGGQFYGTKEDLLKLLQPFYDIEKPFHEDINPVVYGEPTPTVNDYQNFQVPGSNTDFSNLLQHAVPNAPKETCDGPHPHKITSTFPKGKQVYEALVNTIVDFITKSTPFPGANTYLSLHGMGGQVARATDDDNSFAFKDKDFLLQPQAWWADPADPETSNYMNWIESFRQALLPHTEGSFINFPDVNLVKNYETKKGRLELLEFYYAHNLDRLRQVKDKYDQDNLFSFAMSLPPMKAH